MPSSYALTTVQAVLDRLGEASHPQPQIIESWIDTASRMIMLEAEVEWKPLNPTSTTRSYPIAWNGYVNFAPDIVSNVTLLRANTEQSSPVTLAASDYQYTATHDGSYAAVQLLSNYSPGFRGQQGLLEVTGTFGSAVPSDVSELCAFQVVQWVRRNLQARSGILESDADAGSGGVAYVDLAPSVKRWLRTTYSTKPVVA